jgi:hypothetical protein
MSLLKKLFSRPQPATPTVSFPVTVEVVEEKLRATIYSHTIQSHKGPVPCWTYISDGLLAHGQKELVFTLRREKNEAESAFPQEPLMFFRTVYRYAEKDQLVDAGAYTQFGPNGFWGRHILYSEAVPCQSTPPLPLPEKALHAHLVTDDELKRAFAEGVLRILARLGHLTRYFPTAPWSERNRPSLTFETSLLARTPCLSVPEAGIVKSDTQYLLTLTPVSQRRLSALADWTDDSVLAFLFSRLPSCDACLAWVPRERPPFAISPEGSQGERVAGCFLLMVPQQEADTVSVVEDGYALLLTTPLWEQLRAGLLAGEDFELSAASFSLLVNFVPDTSWDVYRSAAPAPAKGPLQVTSVVLLTGDAELRRNLDPEVLSGYISQVKRALESERVVSSEAFELRVQLTLHPEHAPEVTLAVRDALPEALHPLLDRLQKAVENELSPTPTHGPVSFALLAQLTATLPQP